MSCERSRKTLAGLAAGAAPPADVDAHLAACVMCRAELDSLREGLALADAALREIVADTPGPQLARRIARAVAEERESVRISSPALWRWVWTAASVGLLLVLSVAWQRGWLTNAPAARHELAAAPISTPVPPTLVEASRRAPPGVDEPLQRATASARSPRGGTHEGRVLAEPVVLVPPGEAEALQQFADELSGRIVDPDSLLVADPMRSVPAAVPIRIEPLEIAPLQQTVKGTES